MILFGENYGFKKNFFFLLFMQHSGKFLYYSEKQADITN